MLEADPGDSAAGGGPSGRPRAVVPWLKLLLLGTVLYYVVRALTRQLAGLDWSRIDVSPGPVVLATLCVIAGWVVFAVLNRVLLLGFCEPPSWLTVAGVFWGAQLGKYLPGKVASVAAAVWTLARLGVPGHAAAGAVLLSQGLGILLGLIVALPLVLHEPVARVLPDAWLWLLPLLAGGLACLHPRVFGGVLNLLLRKLGRQPLEVFPRLEHYLITALLTLFTWALFGASLWFMARGVAAIRVDQLLPMISAAALASTVGYLAIFAPAGVGVREGVLLVILNPLMGEGPAAIVVVLQRLMQTLVELGLAGIGLAIVSTSRG